MRGEVRLEADGIRALFLAADRARRPAGDPPPEGATRLLRTLARTLGAAPRTMPPAVLDRIDALTVEESRDAGVVRVGLSIDPAGLAVVFADERGTPIPEADGADVEVRFSRGVALRETVRASGAILRAGAALAEIQALSGIALDFAPLGRIELTPYP